MTAGERRILVVEPVDAGMRLDRFLAARFAGRSRSYLQKLIRDGHVLRLPSSPGGEAPGALRRPSRGMTPGERLEVCLPAVTPSRLVGRALPLEILNEDSDIIVLDKPSGLVVHPGAGSGDRTLVHGLLAHCRDLSGIGGVERPGIVHRLDKDTSGVIVVAKNDAAHRNLVSQFQDRTVEKVYRALVWGRVARQSGSIDLAIGRDVHHRVRISPRTRSPRSAFTEYRVLERLGGFTWLEVIPRTGRTHQIRVHMKQIGHPIVGDTVYGGGGFRQVGSLPKRTALQTFGRLALHALRIRFRHPADGRSVCHEAPLPASFTALLEALRSG